MNSRVIYLIVILITVCCIGSILCVLRYGTICKSDNSANSHHEETLQYYQASKKLCVYKLIEEGIRVNPNLTLIDTSNIAISFKDLHQIDSSLYYLYIPPGGCHRCLAEVLQEILQFGGKEFRDKIVFISSFMKPDKRDEIVRDYQIALYILENEYLGFLSERENLYFIFRMDIKGVTSRYHILDGNLSQISAQYLKYCRGH